MDQLILPFIVTNTFRFLYSYLVSQNCIKSLCDILVWPDTRIVEECLEGLERILMEGDQAERGNGVNHFAKLIDEAGGLEKIKNLLTHDTKILCVKAARILQAYRRDVALPAGDVLLSFIFCYPCRNSNIIPRVYD